VIFDEARPDLVLRQRAVMVAVEEIEELLRLLPLERPPTGRDRLLLTQHRQHARPEFAKRELSVAIRIGILPRIHITYIYRLVEYIAFSGISHTNATGMPLTCIHTTVTRLVLFLVLFLILFLLRFLSLFLLLLTSMIRVISDPVKPRLLNADSSSAVESIPLPSLSKSLKSNACADVA